MAFGTEQLDFDSEYEFDVSVEYEQKRYPGKLSLKRTAVHLTVYAESMDGTHDPLPWRHIARVECPDFRRTITLFDLRFMSGSSRSIDYHPQQRGFSESKYEVGYVLYSKTQFGLHESFDEIRIHKNRLSNPTRLEIFSGKRSTLSNSPALSPALDWLESRTNRLCSIALENSKRESIFHRLFFYTLRI
jgi:hypothetical protein